MFKDVNCSVCLGANWVCENHPDKRWPEDCQCGAGMPCRNCGGDFEEKPTPPAP